MSDEKTFEPITTQEAFDERIKARLARERERWEKEGGVADLRQQLAAREDELEQVRADHHRDAAQRAVREHLRGVGVEDDGRVARIMRHVDLAEVSVDEPITVTRALSGVKRDMPELFEGRRLAGAGSGGSSRPVLNQEKPLSRDEVEKMSPEEINSPAMWERVQKFLAGERG